MSAKKLCAKLLNYLCLVALNRRWTTLCLASLFIQIDMAWYRRIRFWLMMARSATSRRCNCAWANVRFHHESWSICQSLVKEQLSRKRSPHREFVALYLVGCFWVFDIFELDVKRCGFLMPSIETCQFYVLLVGFEDGVRWNLYTFKVQYLRDPDAKHRTCNHLCHGSRVSAKDGYLSISPNKWSPTDLSKDTQAFWVLVCFGACCVVLCSYSCMARMAWFCLGDHHPHWADR